MRLSKMLAALGMASILALAAASPAAAKGGHGKAFRCNGVFTGVTVKDVLVPRGGACTLLSSTVKGKVKVLEDAYFQSTGTSIKKSVDGHKAQTIFIDTGSSVRRGVKAHKTAQVFVYNSTVGGDIDVKKAHGKVQVCGTTVFRGDIDVKKSGTDILIGDPLTVGCPGNTVRRGDVRVQQSFTDVELVIRGNSIARGDLLVLDNSGPSVKFVQDNTGGDTLKCSSNDSPFVAYGNTGWNRMKGQCAGP